jgi:hypothetical protein
MNVNDVLRDIQQRRARWSPQHITQQRQRWQAIGEAMTQAGVQASRQMGIPIDQQWEGFGSGQYPNTPQGWGQGWSQNGSGGPQALSYNPQESYVYESFQQTYGGSSDYLHNLLTEAAQRNGVSYDAMVATVYSQLH